MTGDDYEPKLWPVSLEGKWGFIDAQGSMKIEPQFADARPFREGLALVSVPGGDERDLVFDRKYDGFIDAMGQFVIPAEFPPFYTKREAWDSYGYSCFEDGVAVVRDASGSDGFKGLIDHNGKLIAPMIYRKLSGPFREGLCSFESDTERGYMDYRGNVVLRPAGFRYGSGFSEGRVVINVNDGEEMMIDRLGKVIVGPGKYTSIFAVSGGLSRVVKDGKVGLIDRNGRVVVRLGEYSQIAEPEPGNTYIGENDGVFYAIDSTGNATKLPDFGAEPMAFRDDKIWLRSEDDKVGVGLIDGTIIVDPIFDELPYSFHGSLCMFMKGREQGYTNLAGKIVWSTENWELPLQYSIREPLQSYLPTFGLHAMPFSHNWDCENAIVFVCDGTLEELRKYYLRKQSRQIKVKDYTNYKLDPGKLSLTIAFEGVAYLEVFAMYGDVESRDTVETDFFVSNYCCNNMAALRQKFPNKTIGIIIEN